MWLHSNRTYHIKEKLKEIGNLVRVTAGFTFKAKSEEWL